MGLKELKRGWRHFAAEHAPTGWGARGGADAPHIIVVNVGLERARQQEVILLDQGLGIVQLDDPFLLKLTVCVANIRPIIHDVAWGLLLVRDQRLPYGRA